MAVVTTNLSRARSPGNVLVARNNGGLPRDSVVNVTQLSTLDKRFLEERLGILPDHLMAQVDAGLRLALAL